MFFLDNRDHAVVKRSLNHVITSPPVKSLIFYCRILLSIRETGGDWADGQHGRGDPILKGEKDPKAGPNIKIPDRDIGPSSTQV